MWAHLTSGMEEKERATLAARLDDAWAPLDGTGPPPAVPRRGPGENVDALLALMGG